LSSVFILSSKFILLHTLYFSFNYLFSDDIIQLDEIHEIIKSVIKNICPNKITVVILVQYAKCNEKYNILKQLYELFTSCTHLVQNPLKFHKVNHFKQRGVLSKTIYCTTFCTILVQVVSVHFIAETRMATA